MILIETSGHQAVAGDEHNNYRCCYITPRYTLYIVPWDVAGVSCEVLRNYGSCSHSSRGEAQFASKALLIMMLWPQSDLYYILDQRMLGKIIASLETRKSFSKCSHKSIWCILHAYLSLSLFFQVFKEKYIYSEQSKLYVANISKGTTDPKQSL